MATLALVLALLAAPAYAQTMSIDQRLAAQVAGCSLQLAQYGYEIDQLKARIKQLEDDKAAKPEK